MDVSVRNIKSHPAQMLNLDRSYKLDSSLLTDRKLPQCAF